MFGRKTKAKRATNILFVMFRLVLSVVMFTLLLGGIYAAYKHFSGLDPLKLDPKAVLGQLVEGKIPQEALQKVLPVSRQVLGQSGNNQPVLVSKLLFKFLLVADSHNDISNLNKALSLAKKNHPDIQFIIGLGDYTEVGTLDELKNAKQEFDLAGLRYFLIPGDHDLWDARDKGYSPDANFRQIFGPTFQSFIFDNFQFILLYNSDNYGGMGEEQLIWLNDQLGKAKEQRVKGIFVFVHEPLFHPSSDHVMGRVEKKLKEESKTLIHTLKGLGTKVFAGDIHFFSQYSEPETKLEMVTIGAITIDRNPQSPRFAVVSVFEDGSSSVEDVEIR